MIKDRLKITFKFIHEHPFANRHAFLAYRKFFKWQFQLLIHKKLIRKKFIENVFFYAKRGLTGVTGNIYCGLHEFEDMSFLLHFLRSEDLFFDVGANVGSYSLLASGVTKCKTLSFEPSPATFGLLSENIKLNRLESKITAFNIAVGNMEGYLNFTENQDTTNHVIADSDTTPCIKVKVKKLDDFSDVVPRLMKIDVEGFEAQVLNGGMVILNNPMLKAIIIELNGSGYRYGFDEQQIHYLLTDLGFKPYKYEPFSRNLILLPTFTAYDTIYIRDLAFVQQRLSEAKAFKLWNELI